jgi:hypothetical protein
MLHSSMGWKSLSFVLPLRFRKCFWEIDYVLDTELWRRPHLKWKKEISQHEYAQLQKDGISRDIKAILFFIRIYQFNHSHV